MRQLLRSILRSLLPRRRARPAHEAPRSADIRVSGGLFAQVRAHVENFSHGEEAGFLVCSVSRLATRDVLLAREWLAVPDEAIERNANGSVLSWSAEFNSHALDERALALDGTLVLVHSHGAANPRFSADDRVKERALFGTFSRLLGTPPTGTVILGEGDAIGSFWTNGAATMTLDAWPAPSSAALGARPRRRLARQSLAIGPTSDAKLAAAKVAIIGLSGGGSHVNQQLAHQGIGTIVPVDDEVIDETNLGRVVGATESDVDTTRKVDMAERVAHGIDPSITVVKVAQRFPSPAAIAALKEVDVIVACVDRFDAREGINAFARRYMIPLVDVGLAIGSGGERLAR